MPSSAPIMLQTQSFQLAAILRGNSDAAKLALILPGRLDTKDYAHMTSLVEFLAECGYLAISFDPPATWDSPGDISEYTTTNYIKAVHELIDYFGNRPTLLAGHSRGGKVAIHAGADNPAVNGIAAIMPSYGAPSPPGPDEFENGVHVEYRDLPPGESHPKEQKRFSLPEAYFIDGAQYDSVPVLERCTKPKLLIYGDRDKFTDPEAVKAIYADIPEPKMLYELNSGHDYRFHSELITEVNEAIGRFNESYVAV